MTRTFRASAVAAILLGLLLVAGGTDAPSTDGKPATALSAPDGPVLLCAKCEQIKGTPDKGAHQPQAASTSLHLFAPSFHRESPRERVAHLNAALACFDASLKLRLGFSA